MQWLFCYAPVCVTADDDDVCVSRKKKTKGSFINYCTFSKISMYIHVDKHAFGSQAKLMFELVRTTKQAISSHVLKLLCIHTKERTPGMTKAV